MTTTKATVKKSLTVDSTKKGIPTRRTKGRPNHDWLPIRTIYIEGEINEKGERVFPRNKDLAERFGIGEKVVSYRASKQQWPRQRQEFRERLEKESRENKIKSIAQEAADFDVQCLKLARIGIAQVITHFDIIERRRATDPDATLTPSEISKLARALAEYQAVGHKSMGMAQGDANNPLCVKYELPKPVEEMTPEERLFHLNELRKSRMALSRGGKL